MGGRTWRETTCDGAIKNIYLGLHYQHTLNDKNPFKEILDLDFYDKKGMMSSSDEAKVASGDAWWSTQFHLESWASSWMRMRPTRPGPEPLAFLHTDGTKWVFLDIGSWWFSVIHLFVTNILFEFVSIAIVAFDVSCLSLHIVDGMICMASRVSQVFRSFGLIFRLGRWVFLKKTIWDSSEGKGRSQGEIHYFSYGGQFHPHGETHVVPSLFAGWFLQLEQLAIMNFGACDLVEKISCSLVVFNFTSGYGHHSFPTSTSKNPYPKPLGWINF